MIPRPQLGILSSPWPLVPSPWPLLFHAARFLGGLRLMVVLTVYAGLP